MSRAWTQEEEADRLRARFDALKAEKGIGQAEFARVNKVPGGPSLLSQHIKNRRPINLEAATAYAKGFGCTLAEISPRLSMEVASASSISSPEPSSVAPGTVSHFEQRTGQRRRASHLEVADGFIDLLAHVEAPVLDALAGLLPALVRNPSNQQIIKSVRALFEPEAFPAKVQHKG